MTGIFAKYHRRTELREPPGHLPIDVTQPRVIVPVDAMVDGGADIEPGSIIWREKR